MTSIPTRMSTEPSTTSDTGPSPTLVIGGTGITGRRVAEQLAGAGRPVRVASRRGGRDGVPAFDWDDEATWTPSLEGAGAAYLTYPTDLGLPGAAEQVGSLAAAAAAHGVRRVVLLSGRGQHSHVPAEQAVRDSGAAWTILRSAWFDQNFTEGFLAEMVHEGVLALPAGDAADPFVDLDDLAAVAVAALTDDRHSGQTYEVTGPQAVTFAAAAAEISATTGHAVRYLPITDEEFAADMTTADLPSELVQILGEVFIELRSGAGAQPTDNVRHVLGRPPRSFADFVRTSATASQRE